MADKDPMTAAAEATAREVVKAAYGDLLQPAARVVGNELGEFASSIVIAGRGFGYVIREKYEPFIRKALSNVPKDKRQLPPPKILGEILEAVTYEDKTTEIYEMFEQLLSGAMNEDLAKDVHPAFVGIIKRMSSKEAALIKRISDGQLHVSASSMGGVYSQIHYFDGADGRASAIGSHDVYFDNLRSSGLIQFVNFSARQNFRQFEEIAQAIQRLESGRKSRTTYHVRLSPFGQAFTQACIRKP